jgi:hypothetical protein
LAAASAPIAANASLDNLAAVRGSSTRPPVDVVVPFAGSVAELGAVCRRLASLQLRSDDSLLVVDNTPARGSLNGAQTAGIRVVHASERRTPGFARNHGAACGTAEWLVFIDADAAPAADLLDRYFEPPPADDTALLGGGVVDEQVNDDASAVARYASLRHTMSQQRTFAFGEWGYPKSANIACRRNAFEAVGGFREDIRAAEDADLTYRLRAAGFGVERREGASVVHFNRRTLLGLIRQQALWGAGGAWLERAYPGSVPLASGPALARWALGATARGLLTVRPRDRDGAIYALLRPVEALAFELGRLLPNERPLVRGHTR